ncbi:MAG: hypothetical protein EPO26_04200 [Chloroflexota bacterium]|nr:MAG: hypothetical protein EPO26_04200 [Chloroflexota bacterium]
MIAALLAALVAATIAIVPGLAISRLARVPLGGLSGAAALGCAFISLLAYGAGQLGLGLGTIALVAVLAVVAGAAIVQSSMPILFRPSDRRDWFSVGAGALAAPIAWSQGTWLSHTADSFYHLAAIRSLWLRDEAFPRLPMYADAATSLDPTGSGLHSIAAVAIYLTGANTLDTWRLLHPLAAALLAATYARLLTRVAPGSTAAVVAGLTLLVASEGLFDLRETIYPHAIALAALWTLAGLATIDPSERTWRHTALLGVGLAGLAAIHAGVAIIGVVVVALAIARRPLHALGSVGPGVAILIARLMPLTAGSDDPRVGFPAYPAAIPTFGASATYPWAELAFGRLALPPALTIVAVAVATATLCVWAYRRQAPRSWPIVAVATLPALGLLAPFAEAWPAIGYAAMRVAIPAATFQAATIVIAVSGLARSRPPVRSMADVIAATVAAAALLASIGTLRGLLDARPEGRGLNASRAADVPARIAALARALPPGAVDGTVLTDPVTGYYLAGLIDARVATTPRNHTPAAIERTDGWLRRADVIALVNASAPPERLAAIAAQWPNAPLIIARGAPGATRWMNRPLPGFARVADVGDWLAFARTRAAPSEWMEPILDRDAGAWGYAPAEPIAGDAVVVRVRPSDAREREIEIRSRSGQAIATGTIEDSAAMLIPPPTVPAGRYDVVALGPSGERHLGQIALGNEYEAESFPVRDLPPRGVSFAGWRIYDLDYYGRGRAALTGYDGTIARPILPLPPGRYRIVARVFDYDARAANIVTVAFGDATATLTWTGGTNGPTMVHTDVTATHLVSSLALTATRVGQPFSIVDWVRIYPADRLD